MNNYQSGGGNWLSQIPPVTRNLIIINVLIWLVEFLVPGFRHTLVGFLGLHYVDSSQFNPLQMVTYMFLHEPANPTHVLFNMFTLWMFGRVLERVWGPKRFLVYYFVCGIGAAFIQEAVWAMSWHHDMVAALARTNGMTYDHMEALVRAGIAEGDGNVLSIIHQFKGMMVTIGASGAIFGLLLGFAFVFPDMPLYLFFIPVPIKAKYMVIGYAVIEFFLGVNRSLDTVAHFAHLGGMIFGLALLLYWKKRGTLHGNRFY